MRKLRLSERETAHFKLSEKKKKEEMEVNRLRNLKNIYNFTRG